MKLINKIILAYVILKYKYYTNFIVLLKNINIMFICKLLILKYKIRSLFKSQDYNYLISNNFILNTRDFSFYLRILQFSTSDTNQNNNNIVRGSKNENE